MQSHDAGFEPCRGHELQAHLSDLEKQVESRTHALTIVNAELRAEMARWDRFSAAISRVLDARRPRTA